MNPTPRIIFKYSKSTHALLAATQRWTSRYDVDDGDGGYYWYYFSCCCRVATRQLESSFFYPIKNSYFVLVLFLKFTQAPCIRNNLINLLLVNVCKYIC